MATKRFRWSDWVYTQKLSTGSWARVDLKKMCGGYSSLDIECKTADGENAVSTEENFDCSNDVGFVCRNNEQDNVKCSNYKFRLKCSVTEKAGEILI